MLQSRLADLVAAQRAAGGVPAGNVNPMFRQMPGYLAMMHQGGGPTLEGGPSGVDLPHPGLPGDLGRLGGHLGGGGPVLQGGPDPAALIGAAAHGAMPGESVIGVARDMRGPSAAAFGGGPAPVARRPGADWLAAMQYLSALSANQAQSANTANRRFF